MRKILAITNEYNKAISEAVADSFICIDGIYDYDTFKNAVKNNTNITDINLIIFDSTAFTANVLIDCIRWVSNRISDNTQIVLIYPNLTNRDILRQLEIYNINKIIKPDINIAAMTDEEINTVIGNELRWALNNEDNGTYFSNDNLSERQLSIISSQDYNNMSSKLRVLGFYTENDGAIKALNATEQYEFIDISYASENTIGKYNLNSIDLIICDRVSIDFIAYIKSIIDTNMNKAVIVAGYKNQKDAQNCQAIPGVNSFTYKDNNSFIRQVAINSNKNSDDTLTKGGCQIIGVYGVKGGVGSTTLTSILAKEYLQTHPGKRVLAVDFTTKTGDLAIKFGIEKPTPNIFECAMSFLKAKADYINLEIIKSKVCNYFHVDKESGVYVIPSGFGDIYRYCNYQFSAADTAYVYEFILNKLYGFFDVIFIDIDKSSGFTYDIVLKQLDKLILVSDCTLPSVFQLQIKLNELNENRYDKDYYVLFNKADIYRNNRDLDNSNSIKSLLPKNKISFLSSDDHLIKETVEMGTKYKKKFKKEVRSFIDKIEKMEG